MRPGALFLLGAVLAVGCGGRAEGNSGQGGAGGVTAGAGGGGNHTATGGVGGAAGGGTRPDAGPLDAGLPDAKPPPGQEILFEVSYENYAWSSALEGVFITADGSVYSFDYFDSADGGYGPTVIFPATEEELRSRYGVPKQTGSIPLDELMAHFALVEPAASGVLLQEYSCADAGETSFLGYLYDEATAQYTRVILEIDGDFAAKNTSPAAAPLVSWLSQFAEQVYCELTTVQCTGVICSSLPPSCPSGQLPRVVDGCWGECVSVSRCLEVPDCNACGGGGMACATSTTGSHHCIPMYCANADACACAHAPPCAGGESYCTNTGNFEVRCGG